MNVLAVQVYKGATGDRSMKLVPKTSDNPKIITHGDESWPIEGTLIMRVWRRKDSCLIKVNLVKGSTNSCNLGSQSNYQASSGEDD